MLVLSRKRDEVIDIFVAGLRIEVCICDFRGDQVRVGITAPREVGIFRREICDAALAGPEALPDRAMEAAQHLETVTARE